MLEFFNDQHTAVRVLIILIAAGIGHLIIEEVRRLAQWMLTVKVGRHETSKVEFSKRFPRVASLMTIFVSAVTFTIYFLAVGLILQQFEISLTTYMASATVIGLAIGFGLQGFVQDVVIGLTLIFSDALNLGEVVEMSGQIGRVDTVGLRFTVLINIHGQKIYIPNRNIVIINRYRRGVVRAYVDIQIPEGIDAGEVSQAAEEIAKGMAHQYRSIIINEPENFGIKESKHGDWNYVRIKFRIWPGQNQLIETTFRQRVIAAIKKLNVDYPDWMITVVYRVD